MNIWFWVWVALAVILLIAEIFTAGFFMLPFGIGAAVAAALEYLAPGSIGWQWAAFVGVSSALLIVLRRFADRITHEPPQKVAADRLLGRTGVVLSDLESNNARGMVRVDREEWRADHRGEGTLPAGARVTVVSVEGTHLIVEPAASAPAPSDT
jgi:membrane protein implicated in regulation of membrane protease activity